MSTTTTARVHRHVAQVMGMPISLALRGRHAHGAAAERAWDRVLASLREADAVFSTYRADSAISRLARSEVELRDCPPEVLEVFTVAERARRESGGAFDIVRTGPDRVAILDPSGIVKGWATERAAMSLRELEGTDFCLSSGGDVVCHVADAEAPSWQIGIEDPTHAGRLVAVVPVRDGAVATSGSAHRGAHILDPRTAMTPTVFASVTVVTDSLLWADVDATTAFVLGHDALPWLAGRPSRSGVVVWADGRAEVYGTAT